MVAATRAPRKSRCSTFSREVSIILWQGKRAFDTNCAVLQRTRMPILMKKITMQDYYDLSPSSGNSQGDIWVDLPTHGLLGPNAVTGIVITPACDLANSKVETITYLPVVPVCRFFSMPVAIPELRSATEGQLKAAQMEGLLKWFDAFAPPEDGSLIATQQLISEAKEAPKLREPLIKARL